MFKVFGDRAVIEGRQPVALTFGNFDGVHQGHVELLRELIDESAGLATCAVTFFPHPTRVFAPDSPKPMILTLQERVQRLLETGIDAVVVQDFSEEFAELSADDFLRGYLDRHFQVKRVLLGYDFSYGKDRSGNFEHLSARAPELGWKVKRAAAFELGGEVVSSTRIREAIVRGQVEKAELLMCRPFELTGVVVHGDKRGRTIGFPTANLEVQSEILPLFGVYACEVHRWSNGQTHPGVMNCGYRPTLGQDLRLQIEAHLLDFQGDLYGERLSFRLKRFIRKELRFSGLRELKEQIAADSAAARQLLKSGGS